MADVLTFDVLIARLQGLQAERGLTNRAMAGVLRISPSAWSRLQSRQRRGSTDFSLRAFEVLADPDLFLPAVVRVRNNSRKTA